MPAFVTPYMIGLVTAPLAAMVLKPLLRGTVKTTIGIALQVRKLAAEAAEDVQDIAAEMDAEFAAAEAEMSSDFSAPKASSPKGGARHGAPGSGPRTS